MPATFDYHEMHGREELAGLHRLIAQKSNRSLQTAHPQGGNPISDDRVHGVVDRDFRVHGFDNLYVCDASVFPTAITVNPQFTVMALAHYATNRLFVRQVGEFLPQHFSNEIRGIFTQDPHLLSSVLV